MHGAFAQASASSAWMIAALVFMAFCCRPVGASQVASAPITSRELVEIRDLSGLAVSPDGGAVAVRVDQPSLDENRSTLQWNILSLNSSSVQRSTVSAGEALWSIGGTLQTQVPQWSHDSQWLYYRVLRDREVQVWRSRRDGSLTEQITRDEADVDAFLIDSKSGRLFYTVRATRAAILAAEDAEYRSGVLMDESVIPLYPVVRGFPYNGRFATWRYSSREDSSDQATLLGGTSPVLKVVDLKTSTVRVAEDGERNWFDAEAAHAAAVTNGSGPLPSPGGERVARLVAIENSTGELAGAGRQPGFQVFWTRADEPNRKVLCPAVQCSGFIRLLGWRSDGRELIFLRAQMGVRTLFAWNVSSHRLRRVRSFDGYLARDRYDLGACPFARDEVICVSAAASQPPVLESASLASGKTRVLFDPNPGFTPQRLGASRRLELTDGQGARALGRLIRPVSPNPAKRRPLVVTSYGCGGFLRGGSGDDVPEHVLAGLDFEVLCVDLLATTISEISSRVAHLDGAARMAAYSESMVRIFEDGIAQLERAGLIDSRRVGVSGMSRSAHIVAYALGHVDSFAAAVMTTPGYEDAIHGYLFGATEFARQRIRTEELPFPYEDPGQAWKSFSPALNAGQIRAPLLMQLSESEYLSAMELFSNMRDAQKTVEMIVFPDEFHIKHQPQHRLSVYERNVDWLRFWLQGRESDDPAKKEQFERWRAYRAAAETRGTKLPESASRDGSR